MIGKKPTLTAEQAQFIGDVAAKRRALPTDLDLAVAFGVSRSRINAIANGVQIKHHRAQPTKETP